MVHVFVSVRPPVQSFPPWAGAGLEQVLRRLVWPNPHDAAHGLHLPHTDQPPLTK